MNQKIYVVLDEEPADGYLLAHDIAFHSRLEAITFMRRIKAAEGKGWLMLKELEIVSTAPEPSVWYRAAASWYMGEISFSAPEEVLYWDSEPAADPDINKSGNAIWVTSRNLGVAAHALTEEVDRAWRIEQGDSPENIEYRKMAAGFHAQFGNLFMDGKSDK